MTDSATQSPDARQLSVDDVTTDGPRTGLELDNRNHYAHVRYAALDVPGVIWYDPRDGHEYLTLDIETTVDALDLGQCVLTGIELYGHRNRCGVVDPSERWVLEVHHAEAVEVSVVGDTDETVERVESYRSTEVFEDQASARVAAADRYAEYEQAEWRDAVQHRSENHE